MEPAATATTATALGTDERIALGRVLAAWGLSEPSEAYDPNRGTNNTVRIVRVPRIPSGGAGGEEGGRRVEGGERYVLRFHQNATPERIEAEQRLLVALADSGALAYRVPVAIPTADGHTTAATPFGPATLTPWIPGEPPPRDARGLERAGAALGQLDAALAALPAELAPIDWTSRSLERIHPGVPDLRGLADELLGLLPHEPAARWFAERAGPIEAEAARRSAGLPAQIVHGDYALGNVLADDSGVTGVLDFEIAGFDLRGMELVGALTQSTDDLEPAQVAAFRRGYDSAVRLTDDECAALPALLRVRALGSIMWRAGRWRASLATLDEVADRLRDAAKLDTLADTLAPASA